MLLFSFLVSCIEDFHPISSLPCRAHTNHHRQLGPLTLLSEAHALGKDKMSDQDAPIQIVAHDSQWAQLFLEEQEALHRVLSPWLKGPIEHIGSTSVPGLAAKPVIDIMAAVGTLEESRGAISAVRDLRYLYAPYRSDVMHWFCKPRPSFRTHHLHLVPFGSRLWTAQVEFRDRLRADSATATEYSDLKRKLAESFTHDREAYTEGKSAFVARVIGAPSKQKNEPNQPQQSIQASAPLDPLG